MSVSARLVPHVIVSVAARFACTRCRYRTNDEEAIERHILARECPEKSYSYTDAELTKRIRG